MLLLRSWRVGGGGTRQHEHVPINNTLHTRPPTSPPPPSSVSSVPLVEVELRCEDGGRPSRIVRRFRARGDQRRLPHLVQVLVYTPQLERVRTAVPKVRVLLRKVAELDAHLGDDGRSERKERGEDERGEETAAESGGREGMEGSREAHFR